MAHIESASTTRLDARWTGCFCLLVTLALLVGRLPYRGVRHDGILYFGQALAHLNPAWATSDLYFAHGSQDRYSVFSRLVSLLMARIDPALVDMGLLLSAWALFLAALFGLTRGLEPRQRWLGILAVVSASHFYGTSRVFAFLEPFVTARTWAEPVALLALVGLLRGRLLLAGLALACSTMLHPLVAVPMGIVFFAYLVSLDRRWAWLLALVLPALGLAAAGLAPFAGLLKTYDDTWMTGVAWANSLVFISTWHLTDFVAAVCSAAVLWLASRKRTTPFARLGRAVVIAAPVVCLISFVGADLLRDVLVTQLQLWRILWILDVLALLSLPEVLAQQWHKGATGRLAAVAIFVAVFVTDSWLGTGWIVLAWAGLALFISARRIEVKRSILALAMWATWLVGLALTMLESFGATSQLAMHAQGMAIGTSTSIPFTLPILTLPVALGLILAWERGGAYRIASGVPAGVLLVAAVAGWDQRPAWARYLESARPGQHPFAAIIPPGAQVYWSEDVLATWVLLQRPSFVSVNQTSGLLFNRETTLDALPRAPVVQELQKGKEECASFEGLGAKTEQIQGCQLPKQAFFALCSVSPVHADYLVASNDFGVGVVSRWRFEPADGSPHVTYFLYDCDKLR